jgi:hypothetical protein
VATTTKPPAPSPWARRREFVVKLEPGPQSPVCGTLLNGAMNLDLSGSRLAAISFGGMAQLAGKAILKG